ncbi:SAM-dependent methyltransferase [Pseudonocardia sp. CA-107938]|uniref:SAM-dependent methyltransferase n=1 Tax=Pseudonocardia sp. CA-107938 TaxID=3240021 RepID=UPI003D949ED2
MPDLPVPIVRCELPTPDAIVIDHPMAGRFVLVDIRVDDADLDRLRERLAVETELHAVPPPLCSPTAAMLRDSIAAGMTARTRTRRPLVLVGAAPEPVARPAPTSPEVEESFLPDADLLLDRAHSARVYDVLLGGKTNYWADRIAADEIVQIAPTTPLAARAQRGFMHRVVTELARSGFDQFLDIGAGIPSEPNLHQVAQSVIPTARVVYVDNDPIVLAHAAALMTSDPRGAVGYVDADARKPADILAAPQVRELLDLDRPVAISAVGLLHFLDDEDAHRLVTTLLDAVPAGSALAFSQVTPDFGEHGAMATAMAQFTAAGMPMFPRSAADVHRLFLDGLEPAEPGLVGMLRWRPAVEVPLAAHLDTADLAALTDVDVSMYAALARKPAH